VLVTGVSVWVTVELILLDKYPSLSLSVYAAKAEATRFTGVETSSSEEGKTAGWLLVLSPDCVPR
jgi:hypothetical protein